MVLDMQAKEKRIRFLGLLTRRERWGLSWLGWLVCFCLALGLGWVWVVTVYPFLALEDSLPTDVMVVEGWLHGPALRDTVARFKGGQYRRVYTTGGPISGGGGYINDFNTYASVAAEQLIALGIPRDVVQMAPSHEGERDRTYASALYLARALRANEKDISAINVLTENVHARRTRLLFQEAFGSTVRVGVVPIVNPDYDPKYWWRYSEGVREVLSESIAYLYAKFFFFPSSDHGLPPASEER